MDMFNGATAWLSHQQQPTQSQHIHDPQHVHHDGRQPSADTWKERAGAAGIVQQGMDLSDFDISAPSNPTASPPPTFFNGYQSQNFLFHNGQSSYNPVPYSASAWPNQQSTVPLSSYSTLNGATTSAAGPSQQHSPPPSQMMIDPALTTMNGSSSDNLQQYSPPPNYTTQYTQPQPPQRQLSQAYQPTLHNQPQLSINPSYVQYYQTQQPPQQPQPHMQGTLSPHALHSPTTSLMSTLMPSSFYSQLVASTSAQPISPQARIDNFQAAIKPHLLPNSFNGAGAVSYLTDLILGFGSQDVSAQTRLEILTKIRDNAGNHYFRAWSENPVAIDITREWLKAGATAKVDSPLVETIMPLLHIIDRLPLTIETLKTSKLGKIVIKLTKDPPAPAIKDMAQNVERRWRQLLQGDGASKTPETEDSKSKKRKPTEPPSSKVAPPAKKPAVATSATSRPATLKKEAKPAITSVKDAKSDSSFFSAPKPKPKLPSFKKAPPPVAKKESANIAQPSSIDPFQEALKSMAKAKRDSPAASTPPPIAARKSPPLNGLTKSGQKKKSVTWPPDSQLEYIRYIEKAIYDDDPADGIHHHSIQELDRGEGAALHAHLFEEAIDWTEPLPIDIPDTVNSDARGKESQEKITQEEREQTALGALYMSAAHIPDSPAEPAHVIPDEEVDVEVKLMDVGEVANAIFGSAAPSLAPMASVADLMGQLTGGSVDPSSQYNTIPFNLDPSLLPMMQNLAPDKLQQIMQQLMAPALQQQQPPYGAADQTWNQDQYSDYGRNGYPDEGSNDRWGADGRGRGSRGRARGRGRGDGGGFRNNKRIPCSFFQSGRCKYGDQCDFSHDF